MVRETRHLWVGNLPDNIREDRIREHFKRYGRVQNVKLLGRMENASTGAGGGSNSGVCATVAFMDIKSASKAHNIEHVLDERTLTTEYYEPAAIPSSAGAPSAGSSPAGSGYSGSSSSVNSTSAPASTTRYHLSGEENANNTCAMAASAAAPATWRGTNDSATEFCRRGNTPATYGRTTPLHRWYGSGERTGGATGGESTPSTPGGGTERRRRQSGSGSSRSESSSPEPSDTSRASTPAAPPPATPQHPHPHHANHRTPSTHPHQWGASTANGRPLAICVRNLPTRSTDSSLKDGLYHEYKKHGKVVWVKVVGQNADRYAVVRFKKPSDVEKALEVSQDKLFFGCKISVAPHQSCDDDAESAKPYETDIDEYHPKATRTLFIGNLEKDVTQQQLRDKFKHFGRIIEIDIKKGSGGGAGYAFCQYASISSVVEAIRAMDGEYVGSSRVKLGFGKPVATTCVWVDGLTEHTEKQVLAAISRCGAATSVCVDRAAGAALVHFEQAAAAGAAVRELRRLAAHLSAAEPDQPRLCVDYASRECQDAFYEQLEKHGGSSTLTSSERLSADLTGRYLPTARHEQLRYETGTSRSRAPSFGRGSSRTPRYTHDHYDPTDYAADRRYRVYEELGSSPPTDEAPYDDRLQSVVVSPHRAHRHRHDSSPEDRKHSKERHRSAGGSSRRSRSGSRGERHSSRRRHRKRRDGSGSRGSRTSRTSRAGTPLRDEPDAPPTEPRRPPRERPPLPMILPLPKFALQLLRTAPSTPRAAPAPAPASPPRPPSASSSSSGSAPHSPSLEERIRSLDEKYERWSGSRVHADAPDRSRLRSRLFELDINEVKPSEVVRSLLAKRSVFDEDTERLEGAVRPPSPCGSPRSILQPILPRALRYPFPTHPPPPSDSSVTSMETSTPSNDSDRSDPRLSRTTQLDVGPKNETENLLQARLRLRTPSTEKSYGDTKESDIDSLRSEKRRNSILGTNEEVKSFDSDAPLEKFDFELKSHSNFFRELQNTNHVKTESKYSEIVSSVTETIIKTEKNIDNIGSSVSELNNIEEQIRDELPFWGSRRHSVKEISNYENISDKLSIKKDSETKPPVTQLMEKQINNHENNIGQIDIEIKKEVESFQDTNIHSQICQDIGKLSKQSYQLNTVTSMDKKSSDVNHDSKQIDKDIKEKHSLTAPSILCNEKVEKEPMDSVKGLEKRRVSHSDNGSSEKDSPKDVEERDKSKYAKDRSEKDKNELNKDKNKNIKSIKIEKHEKDRKIKEEPLSKPNLDRGDKIKNEREVDRITDVLSLNSSSNKDREIEKGKQTDDKNSRTESQNHKKERVEKERRRELIEIDPFSCKSKKDEKHRHDRSKKDHCDNKRDLKKENDGSKTRKSSRDESSKDVNRKDSTDSSTSRASYDSPKVKDLEHHDTKEDIKPKIKHETEITHFKTDNHKLPIFKTAHDHLDLENKIKMRSEIKEEKDLIDGYSKNKSVNSFENISKCKIENNEKQRHYSFDSTNAEKKRKERLNSCSSLPSNISGHKRRMSSQDVLECLSEDIKKSKNDIKCSERRESKDTKSSERHKTPKFNKGHFAKLLESKTKDDKKNQVKPPDDLFTPTKENEMKDFSEKSKGKTDEKIKKDDKNSSSSEMRSDLHNNLDFLAIFELRSSEEDEKQRALRKEMKEKKRIQQLQQIQELQMQQGVLQNSEQVNKIKDDKKHKQDEKKKEAAREKRMSTERKSKDAEIKRKNRKQTQSTDSSDSDEPKKHSIFDIIDDEPTYISMYDKVKARSCKNMQKQEEEKRQEKIKAKFSQLKQSRAKREEKKRSSWDEDSESDHDRQKLKTSLDSSSDDDLPQNSKRHENFQRSSIDYERHSIDDYFSLEGNENDMRKLSRKNSRTRIMSDSSDDEKMKRIIGEGGEHKRDYLSENESTRECKSINNFINESIVEDKVKKTSILNLFGKSDSDDNKVKSNTENDSDYKMSFVKSICNDISSENESLPSNRNSCDARKKHKKKQKKQKSTFSDEDVKIDNSENLLNERDIKQKSIDKMRRHNKKEKRKERIRDSFDTDDNRDDNRDDKTKIKRDKRSSTDVMPETPSGNAKREGKMEDIFGPLSDESDKDIPNKIELPAVEYEGLNLNNDHSDDLKSKDKEDSKRRKEKRRKERKHFIKDDDNSLDVDAVSKAIEARLFADTVNNDGRTDDQQDVMKTKSKYDEMNMKLDSVTNSERFMERLKKECKEKRKKKKKHRDDRQSRKEHHYFSEKTNKTDSNAFERNINMSPKTILNIPLPNEKIEINEKSDDSKSLSESPSLPRLTDSPPFGIKPEELNDDKNNDAVSASQLSSDDIISVHSFDEAKCIEIDDIPMPPPIENNIVQDISEVPLPEDPPMIQTDTNTSHSDNSNPTFDLPQNVSEDAVRSIPNIESESDKQRENSPSENQTAKADKKSEEKPRAIISQEETEDAVAALLGESFGGKADTFGNCFEEVVSDDNSQREIETSATEHENIPEEDAEEMRQAVQNLNACEMEIKPETPVSDNDLLLIDTDTEETEDASQDAVEKLPATIMATSPTVNNNTKSEAENRTSDSPNVIVSKPKMPVVQTVLTQSSNANIKQTECENIAVSKEENVTQITSTATPVITSWSLTNNKIETHTVNAPTTKEDNKPTRITANILQIKPTQSLQIAANTLRPITVANRVSSPYQVINHMIRPQVSNMQPPTIKIPDNHVLYQKQGIVISPRMSGDARLQSPKTTQNEGLTSPRLTNMAILTTSPQNLNSGGIAPQNAMQQRSPGQVTVVRMQQPPLSPIQAMHIPHGTRAMISPNRPNSVLVQTQGTPIHFNRLPVTPVLAPISKQLGSNLVQQNKNINIQNTQILQQKVVGAECTKTENVNDGSKIILSPTRLQQTSNASVIPQNRILPMQNAIHVGSMNSLHLSNKVLINSKGTFIEKRDNQHQKSEPGLSFNSTPIIHVANVNQSTTSIIQSGSKPIMCNIQEPTHNRGQSQNVIHSINQQRITAGASLNNVIQIDQGKGQHTVLSVATIRPPTVLTKSEASNAVVVSTSTLTNVVMTPLLLKTTKTNVPIRLSPRKESLESNSTSINIIGHEEDRFGDKNVTAENGEINTTSVTSNSSEQIAKCETDFEELLKDNTNEIKVTNAPEKKLEVNVGNTITVISPCNDKKHNVSLENKQNTSDKLLIPQTADSDEKVEKESDEKNREVNMTSKEILDVKDKTVSCLEEKQDKCSESDNTVENIHVDKMNNTDCVEKQDSNPDLPPHPVLEVKVDEDPLFRVSTDDKENTEHDIQTPEENEFWSTKDLNIESVIKKVDSLCNDSIDVIAKNHTYISDPNTTQVQHIQHNFICKESDPITSENNTDSSFDANNASESTDKSSPSSSKRGGRSNRGRKSDKIQTRQISKPARGGGNGKRGRGRSNKVDKKVKSLVSSTFHNMPGDVYDFHEDSGDETTSSTNKTESRPRLILTIKSPLSGNTGAIPTSTLSIAQKDQNIKLNEKPKEEKGEVFASPSTNTRKSRRLQEKDIQKSTTDDVMDDVVKGTPTNNRNTRETNRKRPTRQAGLKPNTEKALSETRKSPRATKRTRDRSLSDASIDSSDENQRKEEMVRDAKIQKLAEPIVPLVTEVEPIVKHTPPVVVNSCQPTTPTPIMKPPKKMISEISAKLACAFETAAAAAPLPVAISAPILTPTPAPVPVAVSTASPNLERLMSPQIERRIETDRLILPPREPRPAELMSSVQEPISLGEPSDITGVMSEASHIRRIVDNVPSNMMPVGATEATDARVQSPALPHRPPSTHRPADRATPVLIRSGGEGGEGGEGAGGAGAGAGGAGARGYRGAYAGPASLPRGAHHPPPPTTKQVAVVGPHHHHPVSRVTITSVPSISPQGQMNMGDGMYPHFSHHHYQMYQQHFRATQQEIRASASPFTRGGLEAEGSEAPTPPLELRRPPSARVPRPAHSPSPADRHILYAVRCGRSPPPAHGSGRPASALPPPAAPGPPHASQVPREADSLQMLLRRYPVMWQGLLALKNDSAAVQMHFVGGSAGVAADALSRSADGAATSLLRIAQRMRLEPAQLDQVHRKMKMENEHCMLLALPCGRDHMDVLQQSTNLSAGFITYLQRKQAAGIVNVAPSPRHQQSMYTVHIFPSCEFANENLNRIAPDLMHRVANIAHLLIVIATAIG
ncbi:protein split ends isoform X2 [Colias croceus]|uniref:protein split ends isoform X2 n=1 Tax=Colias crocea TaxID=72248 RepID=UPI001E27E2C6|nr:protein split ends isoform X2 [Colias croceus]